MAAKRARDDAQVPTASAAAAPDDNSSSSGSAAADAQSAGRVPCDAASFLKEPRDVMDSDAVASSRLAKRRRSSSDCGANDTGSARDRQSGASSAGGSKDGGMSLQQETLRISNELLRSENRSLHEDVATLTAARDDLEAQAAVSAKRIRDLEADVARLYRGRKKDAQAMQREHDLALRELQQQLDDATRAPQGGAEVTCASADATRAALLPVVSASTAQEMDAYLATCLQWQSKLTALSVELTEKVARIEEDEVQSVLCELVAKVETAEREEHARTREREAHAVRVSAQQQRCDMQQVVQRLERERAETDAFTALERRVLEDRVSELEAQVAQLTVERDQLGAEIQRTSREADAWKQKCALQDKHATRLQSELRTLTSEMQRLETQLQHYQQQEETRAFEALEKRVVEERMEELESQLHLVTAARGAELESAREALETEKQALVESLEAAQLELSVAAAEATVKKNEVARLLSDKMELKKQTKAFAADWRKLASQLDAYKAQYGEQQAYAAQLQEAVAALQQENDALRGREAEALNKNASDKQQQEQLQQRMAAELARLQSQNQQLSADQDAKRSNGESPTAAHETELVARLTHEKRAVQDFFRCYFEAAETKCRDLQQQLAQQQAQRARHRQQAQDSCQMLRMCAQVDVCGESVRDSILDVVATLERIS